MPNRISDDSRGQAIRLIAQEVPQLVLRLSPRATGGLPHNPLASPVVPNRGRRDPPLPVLIPMQSAVPRARRVTSDDQASRRSRPAPTPVPTSGGPASQSVADPSESAHRGRTDSAAAPPPPRPRHKARPAPPACSQRQP